MTCQQVRDQLSPLWSRELPPETAQAVTEHLRACPACRREWDALCAAMDALRRAQVPPAPADLPARISAAVRARARPTLRRRLLGWLPTAPQWRLAVGLAAVATGLVAVAVWWSGRPRPAAPPTVAERTAPLAASPVVKPSPAPPTAQAPTPTAPSAPRPRAALSERLPSLARRQPAPLRPRQVVPKEQPQAAETPPSLAMPLEPPRLAQLPATPRLPEGAEALKREPPAPAGAPAAPLMAAPQRALRQVPGAGPMLLAEETEERRVALGWGHFEPARVGQVAVWKVTLRANAPLVVTLWVQPGDGVEVPNAVTPSAPDPAGLLLWDGKVAPETPATVPLLVRPTRAGACRLVLTVKGADWQQQWWLLFAATEGAPAAPKPFTLHQDRWTVGDLLRYLAWQTHGAFLVPQPVAEATVTVPATASAPTDILAAVAKALGGQWHRVGAAFAFEPPSAPAHR